MNKALMISIQPQHAVNILNGKKTLELRTWIPKDYVGWVYVYITKCKRLSVVHDDENGKTYYYLNSNWGRELNEYIPFRFWFDEYETIRPSYYLFMKPIYEMTPDTRYLLKLSKSQINDYGKGKTLYAWHIKKLDVFDEPKSLSDFKVLYGGEESLYPLKKAPQRSVWIYVGDKD